jgi:hypothetical protein
MERCLRFCDMKRRSKKGGTAIFVCLVYLVTQTYEKKNKMIFLDEKDGPDEIDEIDLLTGSGGEDGWGEP